MKKVTILTAARGQGKSTMLSEVFGKKPGIGGIITLRREADLRDFVNLADGKTWAMQGDEGYAGPWLEVGRFRFSELAFERATESLVSAALLHKVRLLIIDEIGPLELMEKGFAEILKILISIVPGPDLLLVVRKELVDEVMRVFEIRDAEVVRLEDFKPALFLS